MVDIGASMTTVTPVVDGLVLKKGQKTHEQSAIYMLNYHSYHQVAACGELSLRAGTHPFRNHQCTTHTVLYDQE